MILSVSSVFITLVITFLMIILFYLILFNKKLVYILRSDLLIILSFMIILRLLLPVEWPFTLTIPFPWIMNSLQAFLNYEIFSHFSVISLLLIIWLFGSAIQICKFIIQLKKIKTIFDLLEKTAIKNKVSDFIDIDPRFDYPVWIANGISFPMILGFKKIILIPKIRLEKKEFTHIIQHELEHLKHKDNIIKLFLNIVLIIYWWFPQIYWLCSKIQLVLEMRVDKKVTYYFSEQEVADYAETLLKVQKAISSKTETSFDGIGISSMFYINDGTSTLYYRITYLLNQTYKKSSNILLILIIISLPLISNCIVLEPYLEPPIETYSTTPASDLENGFIVKHPDGSYSIYINGTKITTMNPDNKLLSKYPIITE